MAIQDFLVTHHVFTTAEFSRAFPNSQTDRNLLSRAVHSGKVERVRRGVYVSKTGPFSRTSASPFDIAEAVAGDAAFAYASALQLHGVLHNLTRRVQFWTVHKLTSFTYDSQDYAPHHPRRQTVETQTLFTPSGRTYRVTTREQTLLDCLDRPGLAGGPENLLRSLSGLSYLDATKAAQLAADASYSTRARLGWTLQTRREAWSVPNSALSVLHENLGSGPSYFWSSADPRDSHWVNTWKLYLPEPEEEMAAWLNS
ncbi:MAG TPA: type IV toxin-antitoxin system AbiEi family antitoxin domain-containing protein [Arachnia sp.]|nr:type IV toxin-antitoxin system AbiEi family antitoxin domain-containing protein [Arachnia sp.]HMT87201.1 type IV toxin-antitoxin system AbiEi family antitoxin domain-containing protein [Arachnia sp.]